jgi:3-dehydrosphinganine reductase
MARTPDLRDQHVIVTGGSSGIGLALVRRVLALGAKVSVVALDDGDLARLRDDPPAGAHPLHLAPADVSDRLQVTGAIASSLERHGPAEVLVTCAGVVHPGYVEDLPNEVLERDMAIDYFGTLWCIRAVLPSMLERGSGTIACISSFAGLIGVFGMTAYCPPKYAVRGLCETLRTELKPRGIHVASIYPTDTDTPGLAAEVPQHPPEQDAMQGKIKPKSPEIVVDAILDGIARRRKRIYPGGWNWFLARLANAAPWIGDRIVDRAVAKAATRGLPTGSVGDRASRARRTPRT